ncbi:hypothetical protein Ddye_003798 [Dipteronia dyeriana]|uniref:Endonuclease/exonuclease/phosphatase domain-containing protein n=1 Tax=Dipteronia dyeriana TaxID=168575 RepID=A0AAD9XSY1_9ROSI|nr:hypothetical protein Ddye_003798 [Dipteronia dyeriana]
MQQIDDGRMSFKVSVVVVEEDNSVIEAWLDNYLDLVKVNRFENSSYFFEKGRKDIIFQRDRANRLFAGLNHQSRYHRQALSQIKEKGDTIRDMREKLCLLQRFEIERGVGLESIGSLGGLIVLWNDNLFKVVSCISSQNCIILAGEVVSLKKTMVFSNVYAPNVEGDQKCLWNFIIKAQIALPGQWCIGGDFNAILFLSKRRKWIYSMSSMKNFNDFTLKTKVIDIPLHGGPFTWSNHKERASWARLDRFLLSPELVVWFPKLIQKCLPKNLSDHNPISLGCQSID